MCNLYRMTKSRNEVADWFAAIDAAEGANFGEEVYPGTPGLVVAEGQVRAMNWGFPLTLKGKSGQPLKPKPVNNARSDKLDSFFWRHSFADRRCLIPLTAWAEAQGAKCNMTRTWMSLRDEPLFAAAGVWRQSDEWGACYAMVMTDSGGSAAAGVHSRMPVLLAHADHARWIEAPVEQALTLCRPWEGALTIARSNEPWSKGSAARRKLR